MDQVMFLFLFVHLNSSRWCRLLTNKQLEPSFSQFLFLFQLLVLHVTIFESMKNMEDWHSAAVFVPTNVFSDIIATVAMLLSSNGTVHQDAGQRRRHRTMMIRMDGGWLDQEGMVVKF
jgi:hypothetical protein